MSEIPLYPDEEDEETDWRARALIAESRLAAVEAVVQAAREWNAAKCNHATDCGDPNRGGSPDGSHGWTCPIDVTESALAELLADIAQLWEPGPARTERENEMVQIMAGWR